MKKYSSLAIIFSAFMVSSVAHAQVKLELDKKASEIKQAYPDATQPIDIGIRKVADSGIVEKAPKAGEQAALFELPDAQGTSVKLAELLQKGPVVLVWYRGGWCPYCNIALHGMLDAEPAIRAQGATLLAITPETPDNAQKTILANKLTFPVLSDQGNKVAHLYRLAYKLPPETAAVMKGFKLDLSKINGGAGDELPLAATFVIDKDRTIRWAFVDADYRKRAEPSDVLNALKQLK